MDVKEFVMLFFMYSPFLVLVPGALILKLYFSRQSRESIPLVLYFVLAIIVQSVSFMLWLQYINNLPLLHIYTPIEFALLTWFYAGISTAVLYRYKYFFILLFTAFSLSESLFIGSVYAFNIFSRSLECLILIVYNLVWFVSYFKRESSTKVSKSMFYIISAFFIYYTGSVALFALSEITQKFSFSIAINIWSFHTFLLALLYILLTIGIIKWMKALPSTSAY